MAQNLCLLQWNRKYCHLVAARPHPSSPDWWSWPAVPPEEDEGEEDGGEEEEEVENTGSEEGYAGVGGVLK